MNLLAHFIAIAHYSHIAGDDGRDACLLGCIDVGNAKFGGQEALVGVDAKPSDLHLARMKSR